MPLIPLLGVVLLILGLVWGSPVWIIVGAVLLLAGGGFVTRGYW
jgi:hypothetical protein